MARRPLRRLPKRYPLYSPPTEPVLPRTHKQLLAAWTLARRKRLAGRILYHYNRCKEKGVPVEVIALEDLLNRYMYFQNKCAYCQVGGKRLQMDHFIPVHKGGGHLLKNIVCSCRSCNLGKGCSDPYTWYASHPAYTSARMNALRYAAKVGLPYIPTPEKT